MKRLIVGGVAGGASAAARSRRLSEDAHIVLFERGPDVSFANCGLPYYVGGEIVEREKLLVTTPEMLKSRFKLDVRTRSPIVRWASEVTWRPEFFNRTVSQRQTSAVATRPINSFTRP